MTVLDLLCVVEDGTPRAQDIPPNVSQPISFAKYEDVVIRLTVKTAAGVLVDLTNKTLTFTARYSSQVTDNMLRKTATTIPIAGRGRADVVIVSNDTKFKQPMRYVYDVWMADNNTHKKDQVIPLSTLVLTAGFQPPYP